MRHAHHSYRIADPDVVRIHVDQMQVKGPDGDLRRHFDGFFQLCLAFVHQVGRAGLVFPNDRLLNFAEQVLAHFRPQIVVSAGLRLDVNALSVVLHLSQWDDVGVNVRCVDVFAQIQQILSELDGLA